MKRIYIAQIMEIVNGETINEWRFHFDNEELAEEQVKNAKENGLHGYTHWYTIDDEILNFEYLEYGKKAQK